MEIQVKPKTGIWLYRACNVINYLFIASCLFCMWEAADAWLHDYPLKADFFWVIVPLWAIFAAFTTLGENADKINTIKHRMSNPIKDKK